MNKILKGRIGGLRYKGNVLLFFRKSMQNTELKRFVKEFTSIEKLFSKFCEQRCQLLC